METIQNKTEKTVAEEKTDWARILFFMFEMKRRFLLYNSAKLFSSFFYRLFYSLFFLVVYTQKETNKKCAAFKF